MNSPYRLLKSCSHPEARELLRAAIAERPRPSAMRAAALALGVGAGISVTSAAGATTSVAVAAPSLAIAVGKWVALGMFAGLTLAGGANALSSRIVTSRAASSLARSNSGPALAVTANVVAVTQDGAESPPPAEDVHQATPAPRGAPPLFPPTPLTTAHTEHDSSSSALVPDGRNLGREVAQIDAARQAVAAGNARAALNHLDEYAALDRTATLDREAQLLRIDALLLSGSKAAALRLAQAYLAQHPGDPHSGRLGALVQAHEK